MQKPEDLKNLLDLPEFKEIHDYYTSYDCLWNYNSQVNQFSNNNFSNFVKSINENNLYYFVHSFFVDPTEKKDIAAFYDFGGHKIPAIVSKDNFIGCQFHPERSGPVGARILQNFLEMQ